MRIALISTVFSIAFVAQAHAHIDLDYPTARYTIAESGDNKACPCGLGLSNRLCDNPADRSDPDRSDRITTLTAGSTVTMRFFEYVGHAGRYRVAIDYDGADHDDFNANILVDIPDPSGNQGNTGEGSLWEIEVPLPNTECDNCTLQLVQMMDGNTTDPVPDPAGRSSYYACADIVLVAGNGGTPDAGPGGGGNDAGVGGGNDDGGCQAGSSPSSSLLFLVLLTMLGLGVRRRRRTV